MQKSSDLVLGESNAVSLRMSSRTYGQFYDEYRSLADFISKVTVLRGVPLDDGTVAAELDGIPVVIDSEVEDGEVMIVRQHDVKVLMPAVISYLQLSASEDKDMRAVSGLAAAASRAVDGDVRTDKNDNVVAIGDRVGLYAHATNSIVATGIVKDCYVDGAFHVDPDGGPVETDKDMELWYRPCVVLIDRAASTSPVIYVAIKKCERHLRVRAQCGEKLVELAALAPADGANYEQNDLCQYAVDLFKDFHPELADVSWTLDADAVYVSWD